MSDAKASARTGWWPLLVRRDARRRRPSTRALTGYCPPKSMLRPHPMEAHEAILARPVHMPDGWLLGMTPTGHATLAAPDSWPRFLEFPHQGSNQEPGPPCPGTST